MTKRIVAGSTSAGPTVPSVEVATIAPAAGLAAIVINAPTCNVRVGNTDLEVALARPTVTHAVRALTPIAQVGNTALGVALARPTVTHARRVPI